MCAMRASSAEALHCGRLSDDLDAHGKYGVGE